MTTTAVRPRPSAAVEAPADVSANEATPSPALKPRLFEIPHARGDDYAGWLARHTAVELVKTRDFTLSDRDDIEQDLIVRLLETWPKFDRARGSAKTFVATVVRNTVSNLIRHKRREQQTFAARTTAPEGEVPSHEHDIDLECDLATVLARLPPEDRKLAERLMVSSVRDIADEDDVPVATVRNRVQRLREAFEAAGLSLEL